MCQRHSGGAIQPTQQRNNQLSKRTMSTDGSTPLKLTIAKTITHLSFASLIIGFSVWEFLATDKSAMFLWGFQCLSLLVFWPWMRVNHPRAYIGVCFVTLMYFIKGVVGVMAPVSSWLDYVLLIGSVTLFISAMVTSRWIRLVPTAPAVKP